jgi:hypothetical protein
LVQPLFAFETLSTIGIVALECEGDNRTEQRSCKGNEAGQCSVHAAESAVRGLGTLQRGSTAVPVEALPEPELELVELVRPAPAGV